MKAITAANTNAIGFQRCLVGLVVLLVSSSCTDSRPVVTGRWSSLQNLKLIGLALHEYDAKFGNFPSLATYDANGKPLLSWRVSVLPYFHIEALNELYEQFNLDEPW